MTLIAAFKCSDGFVVCADSQETVGDHRVSRQKIAPKKVGNFEIAIGGSGIGPLIDAIVHRIETKLESLTDTKTLSELKALVSKELLDATKTEAGIYSEEDRDVRFLVCARSLGSSAVEVWRTAASQLIPVQDYCLVGWAEQLYEHAAKRLYSDGMPITRALLLGMYLLELAESTSNYVRGPITVVVARDNGLWLEKADRVAALTERIKLFTAAVDRLVLACPDITMSEKEFTQRLTEFRETVLHLRKDYLESVTERMVSHGLESYQSAYPELPPGTLLTIGPKETMETAGAVTSLEPSHTCLAHFVGGDDKGGFFPVRWASANAFKKKPDRRLKDVMVCVCGFSHRIFRLNYTAVDPFVFNDVVIRERKCEEAKRCLARQCPLNRTTDETIKKLISAKDRKAVLEMVEKLTSVRQCNLFKDKPSEGGILFLNEEK